MQPKEKTGERPIKEPQTKGRNEPSPENEKHNNNLNILKGIVNKNKTLFAKLAKKSTTIEKLIKHIDSPEKYQNLLIKLTSSHNKRQSDRGFNKLKYQTNESQLIGKFLEHILSNSTLNKTQLENELSNYRTKENKVEKKFSHEFKSFK